MKRAKLTEAIIRMTRRIRRSLVLAVGATALLAACHGRGVNRESTGRADVVLKALSAADVTAVTLVISGGGLGNTPRTVVLSGGTAQIETLVGNLPVGTGYLFSASATDAAGNVLYRGDATPVAIIANETTSVVIYLLQVAPSPPFGNSAPVIDSLVISSTNVAPGEAVSLTIKAHDPDAEDTLVYAWTGTGGGFAPATATNVTAFTSTWSAPNAPGSYGLTATVSDSYGASVAVETTVTVAGRGVGAADATLKFDNSPVVSGLTATPGYLEVGVPTALAGQASDPDGDTLTYAWTSSAAGTFAGGSTTNSFTLSAGGSATAVTITLTVTDGKALVGTGTLTLPVGKPSFNAAPSIVDWYQTRTTAQAGQGVTFQLDAADPAGLGLTFAWSASGGALGTPTNTPGSSTVLWVAPGVPGDQWNITVVVTNAAGISVTKVFTVAGGGGAPVDGGASDGGSGGDSGWEAGSEAGGGGGSTGSGGSLGGSSGAGGAFGGSVAVNVAPGPSPGEAAVAVSLSGTTDTVAAVTVSVSPDSVTTSAGAASVAVSGLSSGAVHTFTVAVTTSSGEVVSASTNPLAFYDVFERFYEPETQPNDSIFIGAFTFDTTAQTVSGLHGRLSESMTGNDTGYPNDAMTWLTLDYQLSSLPDATTGVSGLLVTTFRGNSTNTFTQLYGGDGWSPGDAIAAGDVYYGFPTKKNNPGNAYARIFVNLADPTASLTQAQIDLLAYADCAPGGVMGSVCMTGTTAAGYGDVGSMSGYPVSQVITLR